MAAAIGLWNWAENGGALNLVSGVAGIAPTLCVAWLCYKLANNGNKALAAAGEEGEDFIRVMGKNAKQAVEDTRSSAAEFLKTAVKIILTTGTFDAACYIASDVPVLKCTLQSIHAVSMLTIAGEITGYTKEWGGELKESAISLSSTLVKCAVIAVGLYGRSTICATNPDTFFCSIPSMSTVAAISPITLALGIGAGALALGTIALSKTLMKKEDPQNTGESNDENDQLKQMVATWDQNHTDNLAAYAATGPFH